MTLKQAFTLWASGPKNISLAAKHRQAMMSVLLKLHGEADILALTEERVRDIFTKSAAPQESRVLAANALVYTLQWCSQRGYCPAPTFNYTIGSAREQVEEQDKWGAEPEMCLPDTPKEEKEDNMEEKQTRDRKARKVCQIDPETLQVVKTYDSCAAGCRAVGVKGFDHAIKRLQKAGGYYWQYPEDVDTFAERLKQKLQAEAKPKKRKGLMEHFVEEQREFEQRKHSGGLVRDDSVGPRSVFDLSDDELINEMRRRGWTGDISITKTVKL